MSENLYPDAVCSDEEALNAACEILENPYRSVTISIEDARSCLENAKLTYDDLYSSFMQRYKALCDMKIYALVLAMLNRKK